MVDSDTDSEDVMRDLRKFYRGCEVEQADTDSGTVYIVRGYLIRGSEKEEKCNVGLHIGEKVKEVLVDRDSADISRFLSGNEQTKEAAGRNWIVVPVTTFWEFHRPAYWFMERNLTKFFGA